MIRYHLTPLPAGHRYGIRQSFVAQASGECALYLPVWIPGSYMRRDFARLLYDLRATVNGREVAVRLCSPSAWAVDGVQAGDTIELHYEVYARDVSVRGNYLDDTRGFFNPCAACIAVAGREGEAHELEIAVPEGWQLSTPAQSVFADYDQLIDSPLMIARQWQEAEFDLGGVRHRIIVTGAAQAFDLPGLTADVERACAQALAMFGAFPRAVGKEYHFLLHVTEDTYGGLEHRSSTLLMTPRRDLPHAGAAQKTSGYVQLLGLFAHEYFHTWHVKDMKPRDYQPYQLMHEQPSELLWLFEGFTSYFDDVLLCEAGVISREEYAQLLARTISAYWQRRGRLRQTLAASSLEAWTKLYNGGENANAISTSYYGHGALFAFCLDAQLRAYGTTLATITAALWQRYQQDGVGISEASFTDFLLTHVPPSAHDNIRAFMHDGLHSTQELPLIEAGKTLGLAIARSCEEGVSSECGFRYRGADFAVTLLDADSAAARAGLAMEDRLIAVNGLKASSERLKAVLLQGVPGDSVSVHVFREGVLHDFSFPLAPALAHTCHIQLL